MIQKKVHYLIQTIHNILRNISHYNKRIEVNKMSILNDQNVF
jgi:hypothetical protein